jgi:hypothetical protein
MALSFVPRPTGRLGMTSTALVVSQRCWQSKFS